MLIVIVNEQVACAIAVQQCCDVWHLAACTYRGSLTYCCSEKMMPVRFAAWLMNGCMYTKLIC